jgi:demethylmenaquinone methyltransferase/2-methoxy-6-polyprenyl-1,4-benzoquinol methylase
VPVIGSLAGDAEAYSYLPNSVRTFPEPERLAGMIDAAGFNEIRWLLLAGGIIAIHSATRSQ